MKIGINASVKKLNLIKETFKDYNIKHIQISLPANLDMIGDDIYNTISKYKIENPGVEISIHAYPFNFAESVESVRSIWVELANQTLGFASSIGATFVNFHCGYGIDAGKRKQHIEVVRQLIPVLHKITDLGIRHNIEIHIENLYSEQRNSDFCKIGDRLSDFQKIFKSIDSSMLKLCYDYGHGNLDEHGIDILRNFYYRLGSVHAHDNDQLADIHWSIGNGDLGSINWNEEIKYLNSFNYKGPFILEGYQNDQLASLKYLKKMNLI
jgi:sugar phosphate isomerase/epimerase